MEVEEAQAVGVVGGLSRTKSHHIKKRALKNKALAISFNDKDLRDFVGGFHKRKKKRRKEAQQQIKAKERLRRIEKRKQRKEERQYVQGGGATPANVSGPDDAIELEEDEDAEPSVPVSVEETKTYDTGDLTIMVKTSEICHEDDEVVNEKTHLTPRVSGGEAEKKRNIPVTKKQTFKKTAKHRSGPKQQKKRDKRKGGNYNKREMR